VVVDGAVERVEAGGVWKVVGGKSSISKGYMRDASTEVEKFGGGVAGLTKYVINVYVHRGSGRPGHGGQLTP